MNTLEEKKQAFARLLEVVEELREKCPWDRKQTFASLRTLTVEEVYELAEAIDKNNFTEIKKELGDVLLHIVLYALLGQEKQKFDIGDVCTSLVEKLIFRHPHIYAQTQADTPQEVERTWEQIKLQEKGGNRAVLQGVPSALPALIKAHRIQDKARGAGFDWKQKEDVWEKVTEELQEFRQELARLDTDKIEAEFGDLFFSLINAARLYGINPENALERTNKKFIARFNFMEQKVYASGKKIKELPLETLDQFWNEAKKQGL